MNIDNRAFCCDKMKISSKDIYCPITDRLDGTYGFAHCGFSYCPFCGSSLPTIFPKNSKSLRSAGNPDFCCSTMEYSANYPDDAETHQITYQSWTRRYFFTEVRWYDIAKNCPDEEDYPEYDLQHCLYCGKKLPEPLLKQWFEIVEREFCVDRSMPMIQIVKYLPKEFVTDAWWKNRKIPLFGKVSQEPESRPDCSLVDEQSQVQVGWSISEKISGALVNIFGLKKTPEQLLAEKYKQILKSNQLFYQNTFYPHNGDHIEVFYNAEAVDQSGKSLARKAQTVLKNDGQELYELKMLATGFYNVGGQRKFFKQLVRTVPVFATKGSSVKPVQKVFCCQEMQENCSIDSYGQMFCFDWQSNWFYFSNLKCWFCVFCGAKLSSQELESLPPENNEFCCQSFELKCDNPYPGDLFKISYQCWVRRFLISYSSFSLHSKPKGTQAALVQIYFCMFCGKNFPKSLVAEWYNELARCSYARVEPMEAQLQILQKFDQTSEWWKCARF